MIKYLRCWTVSGEEDIKERGDNNNSYPDLVNALPSHNSFTY